MYVLYNLLARMVMFVQMWINMPLVKIAFGNTHWLSMVVWWMFAPGSQIGMYLLNRDGNMSLIEYGFILVFAIIEIIALLVASAKK